MTTALLLVDDITPTPWMAPDLSVGRGKGGKPFAMAYSPAVMRAYQEAIKEAFDAAYPDHVPFPAGTPLYVSFFYWRKLDQYQTTTGRKQTAKRADTTNINKATEDALQGRLYVNDVDNAFVLGGMVEQTVDTEPKFIVAVTDNKKVFHMLVGNESWASDLLEELQNEQPPTPPGNVYLKVIPS